MTEVLENASLKKYNTFGIDAKARFLVHISSANQLREYVTTGVFSNQNVLILGGGSNVLFTQDFDGWVLVNEIMGIEKVSEEDDYIMIKAAGGENWSAFVDYCVEQNWHGLENLSLIPGKLGAAPVQNIGAYGVEQCESMVCLEAMNLKTGETSIFKNEDCEFGYRSSIFKTSEKGNWVVLNVTYRLWKKQVFNLEYSPLKTAFEGISIESINLKDVSEAVKNIRRSKLPDPAIIGNAGSFFKNPIVSKEKLGNLKIRFSNIPFYEIDNNSVKIPAGWLIETCNWKGKTIGNAGVHDKQALVLVNKVNASGIEIRDLARKIQSDVLEKFSIELDPEVLIL
ncbi:MAG: UDP-N-acetylmuramate dehydrogenase [Bacteroidales bacterium]|nr:UDP-N-acetylmuramate dehydrogenase [Bacteroidales bacterium]